MTLLLPPLKVAVERGGDVNEGLGVTDTVITGALGAGATGAVSRRCLMGRTPTIEWI